MTHLMKNLLIKYFWSYKQLTHWQNVKIAITQLVVEIYHDTEHQKVVEQIVSQKIKHEV